MTSTAELFHRAGVALYGDQYVAPLAVVLGVEKNTVGKWRDGKSRIPPGIWQPILQEVARREKTLGLLQEAIRAMPASVHSIKFALADIKPLIGEVDLSNPLFMSDIQIEFGRVATIAFPGIRLGLTTHGDFVVEIPRETNSRDIMAIKSWLQNAVSVAANRG